MDKWINGWTDTKPTGGKLTKASDQIKSSVVFTLPAIVKTQFLHRDERDGFFDTSTLYFPVASKITVTCSC